MTSAATQSAIASENATSSSSQDSPMDDPLFLHHAESPSTVLITQPLIGRELLNMGSSCEESFTQQEQIGVHWWFSHLIISIGIYSFSSSGLD